MKGVEKGMKYAQIAHYGGRLVNALDRYSRRQLKHGFSLRKDVGAKNSLLAAQKKRLYSVSEWLLWFEARHVQSWLRLMDASRISRRRAQKSRAAA